MSGPALDPAWIAPERTALLIVDMQVDFASPSGALGRSGADLSAVPAALEAAERLADAARSAGVRVIFIGLETTPETDLAAWVEGSRRRGSDPERENALCREGSAGAAFVGPAPAPGDSVIRKRRYSGFLGTGLEAELRATPVDTVVVCGLTTECCVALTAFDAFQRGFNTVVATDACAAYEHPVHTAALRQMELNGVLLFPTRVIGESWR